MEQSYKYSPEMVLHRGTRWAREDEMKKRLHLIQLTEEGKLPGAGLPVISNGTDIYADTSEEHNLIIGGSGCGKTRRVILPMLEMYRRAEESVVVTDPKGELYDATADAFGKAGYKVYVANLRTPGRSNGWNPLALARTYTNSGDQERATAAVNDFAAAFIPEKPMARVDPFWTQTSRAMLQGLANMIVENPQIFSDEEVNLHTLRMLSEHLELDPPYGEKSTFDLLEYYPSDSIARSNLYAIKRGSEKTFDNIRVSYDAPLQSLYLQTSLVDMLSRQEIDFNDLGCHKTILYLIIPDEKSTLNTVATLMIKSCYEQLIALAKASQGNRLPLRVNFLLDEFANLPQIPDVASMLSAGRSRNIRFFLVVQGLYQLSSRYGEYDAQTIKGNCNWIFFTSRELPLLQEISALCGSDSLTGEPLISVSQLQRLRKERGEALMLIGREYPFIAHLPDISRYHLTGSRRRRPLPSAHRTKCKSPAFEEVLKRAERKPHQLRSSHSTASLPDFDDDLADDDDYIESFFTDAEHQEAFGKLLKDLISPQPSSAQSQTSA